jgi:predicted nucleic-acid-binding Zn-ribbon protein
MTIIPSECPHCGSTDFKKSSAVYAQGIERSQSKTRAVGISSIGVVGVGTASTEGRSISAVASANAPPVAPDAGPGGCAGIVCWTMVIIGPAFFVLLFAGFGFGLAVVGAPVLAIGGSIFLQRSSKDKDERIQAAANQRHQQRSDEYDRQWYCMRCGSTFVTEKAVVNVDGEPSDWS